MTGGGPGDRSCLERPRAPVCVVILTYNEEVNVGHALESVKDWAGEILVVDSFSTDRTIEICREYTDRIVVHRFESQARQLNWALDHVPTACEWVLRLDADERVTPALAAELCETLATVPADVSGLYLKRRIHVLGRFIRHGACYPRWFLRVFRLAQGRFEDLGSGEHLVLRTGRTLRLRHDFVDQNRKALTFWIDKHAVWATLECAQALGRPFPQGSPDRLPARFLGVQPARIRWWRQRVYERLPLFLRAFSYFFYRYVLRGGFLDGREGLIFHFLQACWFRFYIDAKIYEAKTVGVRAFVAERYAEVTGWAATPRPAMAEASRPPVGPAVIPTEDLALIRAGEIEERVPLALIVLTYNEAENIRTCLESAAAWVSEIIVVDSFSTDNTLHICREYTDRIYQHPFENQAKQFNWALDHVPIASPWILRLDADEWVPRALALELSGRLAGPPADVTGFYLRRRVYFMDRWMRHGGYYPKWFLRVIANGAGRCEDITEEHLVLARGRAERLRHDFVDYNRKGLTFWTDKHNHWAIGETLDTMSLMGEGRLPPGTVEPALFGTQEQRVRWLKGHLYARGPLFVRAFAYFAYRYVVRGGFLDGREGLIFHFLQACWYRFLVDAKIYEARKFGLGAADSARAYSGSRAHPA